MTKVIQIRGVPDDVHAALVEAAERAGQSLTSYLSDELASVARRADLAWHNRDVIIAGKRAIHARSGAERAAGTGRGAEAVRAARAGRAQELVRRTDPAQ